eukprot:gene2276-1418_t
MPYFCGVLPLRVDRYVRNVCNCMNRRMEDGGWRMVTIESVVIESKLADVINFGALERTVSTVEEVATPEQIEGSELDLIHENTDNPRFTLEVYPIRDMGNEDCHVRRIIMNFLFLPLPLHAVLVRHRRWANYLLGYGVFQSIPSDLFPFSKPFPSVLTVMLAVCIPFFWYIDQPQHWAMDPKELQLVAQKGINTAKARFGEDVGSKEIIEEVIQAVLERYPAVTRSTGNWLWNNAGGAMGSMTVLHCSFSEYLIIFGTPVGTEGHTGRHLAEDFFTILYGEQWAAPPGPGPMEVYKQGEQHYLHRFDAKQYRMDRECWALEYARGNIASMMLFGFLDSFSSTFDVVTIYQTVKESAGNMFVNMLNGKL